MIEKIEPACSAYLERTDPLPNIHFNLEALQPYQGGLTHLSFVVVCEVDLSCQTYGDDYRPSSRALSFTHAVLRYGFFTGFSVFALYLLFISFWVFLISFYMSIFLRFRHMHSLRGQQIMIICSSHSSCPDVANKVPSRDNLQ